MLDIVQLEHVPRSANKMVDMLANLIATLPQGREENPIASVCSQQFVILLEDGCKEEVKIVSVYEIEKED